MKERMPRKPKFHEALITVGCLAVIMFFAIVVFDASPHIPMLLGCAIAGLVALKAGFRWEEIQEGMLGGITQALESLIILMLIGVLIGVWIEAGVVPAMIYYGLRLLSPRFFLVATMVICSIISMAVGSWGTAGTIGLAFMGIAHAMGIPAPLAAGAVISGSYVGDKLSPLSDTTNLASAVTGVNVFDNVRHMFPVAGSAYLLAAGIFTVLGLRYAGSDPAVLENIHALSDSLNGLFVISPLSFLPLVLLVVCILLKVPAIPSIGVGILAAGVQGVLTQHVPIKGMFEAAYGGYLSQTGNEMVDGLLSAGGLEAMMFSVSMIITAMMFGGIMEKTGQMEALMAPLMRHVHSFGGLVATTVATCFAVNLVLPEQYISIAIPGRMYAQEYDKHGVSRRELTVSLGAGGAATSALVPWNTCGMFMLSVLGVSAFAYARYAFFNLLMPFCAILAAFLFKRKTPYQNMNPQTQQETL
ncbi:Na+/H+ antiporter NhaC [Provencibacterium massiliense]|uniref:Na+/H+ antiporter NhaC n=1 Tax=Provencibacterium massiliense TaxID=1841868 RepID=UPI001FA81D67|nr:Na+/H+ antiporter NhaC [Provencibacterium massiliense]